jgi:hypothetical protein
LKPLVDHGQQLLDGLGLIVLRGKLGNQVKQVFGVDEGDYYRFADRSQGF